MCLPAFSTHLSHFASCLGAVPARTPGQHTLPSDKHTHTEGAAIAHHPEPLQSWPSSHCPQPQVTLTSSTWGPSPSRIRWAASAFFCREQRGEEEKKLFVPSVTSRSSLLQLSPLLKTTSQTSTEPSQIPSLPESGWKGSAQPLDPQEKAVGEGLRHRGYHDFTACELCPGSDPDP